MGKKNEAVERTRLLFCCLLWVRFRAPTERSDQFRLSLIVTLSHRFVSFSGGGLMSWAVHPPWTTCHNCHFPTQPTLLARSSGHGTSLAHVGSGDVAIALQVSIGLPLCHAVSHTTVRYVVDGASLPSLSLTSRQEVGFWGQPSTGSSKNVKQGSWLSRDPGADAIAALVHPLFTLSTDLPVTRASMVP